MAVYKIKLSGVFASELEAMIFGDEDLITFKKTEMLMQDANGRDLEVDLSSVGGLVNVGVDIFFMFRDYKRQYPTAQMQLNIKSQAASMASMFAAGEFWDLVTVEDISAYMIHNPSNAVFGDYKIQYKNAENLERITSLYSGVYAKKSGKSDKEIRKMMDETTYFYGEEIVKAGFADEVLKTSEEKNRDSAFATMNLKYDSVMQKLETIKMQRKDIEKVAAKLEDTSVQPATAEKIIMEDVTVKDTNELKEKFPDIHSATMKAGEDQGKESMIANNKAIMEFKNKEEYKNLSFVQMRCDEALSKGEDFNDLKMAVMALMLDPKNQASIESPGDINTGGNETMSGEQGNDVNKKEVKW